jgi:hypothetical protein
MRRPDCAHRRVTKREEADDCRACCFLQSFAADNELGSSRLVYDFVFKHLVQPRLASIDISSRISSAIACPAIADDILTDARLHGVRAELQEGVAALVRLPTVKQFKSACSRLAAIGPRSLRSFLAQCARDGAAATFDELGTTAAVEKLQEVLSLIQPDDQRRLWVGE